MDLGCQIAKGCSCWEVRVLHSQAMVRPCKHEEVTPTTDSSPFEGEYPRCISNGVVKINCSWVDLGVLIEERLMAGIGEHDQAEHARKCSAGLNSARCRRDRSCSQGDR
jgi:hypothetical protein